MKQRYPSTNGNSAYRIAKISFCLQIAGLTQILFTTLIIMTLLAKTLLNEFQVKIDLCETSREFRQATFVLYNCARLSKLFQNFDENVKNGERTVPSWTNYNNFQNAINTLDDFGAMVTESKRICLAWYPLNDPFLFRRALL